jgi:hypothetical protein
VLPRAMGLKAIKHGCWDKVRPLLQTMLTVLTQTRPLNGLDYEITILASATREHPELSLNQIRGEQGVVSMDCGYLLVR